MYSSRLQLFAVAHWHYEASTVVYSLKVFVPVSLEAEMSHVLTFSFAPKRLCMPDSVSVLLLQSFLGNFLRRKPRVRGASPPLNCPNTHNVPLHLCMSHIDVLA
jgi:hypothetical protein